MNIRCAEYIFVFKASFNCLITQNNMIFEQVAAEQEMGTPPVDHVFQGVIEDAKQSWSLTNWHS